jgi:hypothetical protein
MEKETNNNFDDIEVESQQSLDAENEQFNFNTIGSLMNMFTNNNLNNMKNLGEINNNETNIFINNIMHHIRQNNSDEDTETDTDTDSNNNIKSENNIDSDNSDSISQNIDNSESSNYHIETNSTETNIGSQQTNESGERQTFDINQLMDILKQMRENGEIELNTPNNILLEEINNISEYTDNFPSDEQLLIFLSEEQTKIELNRPQHLIVNKELVTQDMLCPIIKKIMLYPLKLTCGHVFDKISIKHWYSSVNVCPLCRTKINMNLAVEDEEVMKKLKNIIFIIGDPESETTKKSLKNKSEYINYETFRSLINID